MGEGQSFAAHVFALSALVALLSGSEALRGVVLMAVPSATGGGAALLVATFLGEVDSLFTAWLVPLWLLTAAAAFVVTHESVRDFEATSGLLSGLGASTSRISRLFLVRVALLASISFVVGVSLGLVVVQVIFRAFIVLLGVQYFVPEISPAGLGVVGVLSVSALLFGSAFSLALTKRRP